MQTLRSETVKAINKAVGFRLELDTLNQIDRILTQAKQLEDSRERECWEASVWTWAKSREGLMARKLKVGLETQTEVFGIPATVTRTGETVFEVRFPRRAFEVTWDVAADSVMVYTLTA